MFVRGDSVSFKDRNGATHIGVVVEAKPKDRYWVRTDDGKNWTVPGRFLAVAKANKNAAAMVRAGDEYLADRRGWKKERNAKVAEAMQFYIKDLKAGQFVKVYTQWGWQDSRIVKVNEATGKVTVVNPKWYLTMKVSPFLDKILDADIIARLERKKEVITVWANRIKKL